VSGATAKKKRRNSGALRTIYRKIFPAMLQMESVYCLVVNTALQLMFSSAIEWLLLKCCVQSTSQIVSLSFVPSFASAQLRLRPNGHSPTIKGNAPKCPDCRHSWTRLHSSAFNWLDIAKAANWRPFA